MATCSATMNARYVESFWVPSVTRCSQLPPIQAGTNTECPRLEMGNSSVTPWSDPITTACR